MAFLSGGSIIRKKFLQIKIFIILIGFFLFIASYIPDFIITGSYNSNLNIFDVQAGSFYYVYSVLAFVLIVVLLIVTFFIHSRSEGIIRSQLKYVLIGVWSFSITALFVSFIFPLFGYIGLAKLDSPSSLLFVGFSAYAIIKHRLMDIRVVLKRASVYFSSIIAIMLIALGLYWLELNYFKNAIKPGVWGPIVLLIGLIVFNPIKRYMERIANKYFFTSLYNYQATLENLGKKLTFTINLSEIVDSIIKTIKGTMHLDRAGVLLQF